MEQYCKIVLVVVVLAFVAVCPPAQAAVASSSPGAQPHGVSLGADTLLASPLADHGSLQEAAANLSVDAAGLLAVTDAAGDESSAASGASEVTDAARHRNITSFLLVILVLGSVIRFVTSPVYLEFIADVLDPKTF